MSKRALLVLVLAGGAWFATLPPRATELPAPPADLSAPIRGAIHVHTRRSDGTGTPDSVAAAAAAAGLRFVILTDHGDGTRRPDPPAYLSGVLVIDGVEISGEGGHVVAIGLPPAPYRLGGEVRDVIEDVHRLGGIAVAAHPGSARGELAWRNWDAPIDGLEWLNADSEWRDESSLRLLRVLLAYPGRHETALALLLDRPETLLRRWDALLTRRRVAAFAGADAHARIGLRTVGEPYDGEASLPIPSYESVFRTFSNALPGVQLTGAPGEDARAVIDALRRGASYTVVDAIAAGGAVQFTIEDGGRTAAIGDSVAFTPGLRWQVRTHAPPGAAVTVVRDGRELTRAAQASLSDRVEEPGAYRVEVHVPGAPGAPPVPWIVTNPIYVTRASTAPPREATTASPVDAAVRYDDGAVEDWRVEHSPRSQGAVDAVPTVSGREVAFRFALGGTLADAPFAALVMPAGPDIASYDRLQFTARATRPLRLSVQLRAPGGSADGERWHRSVYLDTTAREITVRFDDMRPRGAARPRPDMARVDSVLFVVDTVNALPGDNGRIAIDSVRYLR